VPAYTTVIHLTDDSFKTEVWETPLQGDIPLSLYNSEDPGWWERWTKASDFLLKTLYVLENALGDFVQHGLFILLIFYFIF